MGIKWDFAEKMQGGTWENIARFLGLKKKKALGQHNKGEGKNREATLLRGRGRRVRVSGRVTRDQTKKKRDKK